MAYLNSDASICEIKTKFIESNELFFCLYLDLVGDASATDFM